MSNPKVEKCGTCRGAGYHFYGTGTDATCEECGGIGHMPAYSPPATRAIDGEKLLGWIGNNGFGVRSLDYSLSTFRDALTKEIESGAFDILVDPNWDGGMGGMNQAEFERKSKEPVDLDECSDALQRLINREHTLHVPARPDDEDMLLSRALRELKEFREKYPRDSVQWFAERMEAALRRNDHKGGWENENIYWLWERLKEESKELITAVDLTRDMHADPDNIVKEAADVANFAMMIADIARKKLKD